MPGSEPSGRDWESAHPYLRTYLLQHASAAGPEIYSALVRDMSFLVTADQVTVSPYVGLRAFEERDAEFFFGRDSAAVDLLMGMSRRLEQGSLLMVSGASGVGKTSLLQAGVLPRLRQAGLPSAPGAASWPVVLLTPGRTPLTELAIRVASLAGAGSTAVLQDLQLEPARLASYATYMIARRPPGSPVVDSESPRRVILVVDQFEQVFTQCPDEKQRRAFIAALHAAATPQQGAPEYLVVLAVRADFLARCAAYPDLVQALQDLYMVGPMTEQQLRLAITEPARKAGSRVEPDLVDVLLQEVRYRSAAQRSAILGAEALPLISFVLDQTWRSRTGTTLTLADYERTGGIRGGLAETAQDVYDSLTPSQQTAARHVFTRLVAANSDGIDIAVRATVAELTEGMNRAATQDMQAVLEAFAAQRLLILTTDTVELIHDALLTAWPWLRSWLADHHAERVIRGRLHQAAIEWADSSRIRPSSIPASAWKLLLRSSPGTVSAPLTTCHSARRNKISCKPADVSVAAADACGSASRCT